MLGVAIGLIAVAVLFFFIFPPVGFIVGAIALAVLVVYLVGAARRPTERGD